MQFLKKTLITTAFLAMLFQVSLAQRNENANKKLYSNRISLVAGLIQPFVLKGGNFEVTYFTKNMSFDYSHGFSLDMASGAITGAAKTQNLVYHLPYSTGFGIGYRLTSAFDIRIEPKMHNFRVYHNGDQQNEANLVKSYKTYTLGLGAYYRYMPFQRRDNWLQGITTSTSVRWWPNVGSSLEANKFSYQNKFTNKQETLSASNIGIAGSPIIFNVSVGYTFGGK